MACMLSEKGLDLDTAIKLLENVEKYPTISQPPQKPHGGQVFLFLPDSMEEQENYKCDQYRWLNSGPKDIPRKNPLVKKQYFIGKLPTGKTQVFQKHCYVLVGDQRVPFPVLIHYIGDESVMVDYPHGNSKKSNTAYFAIAPSVRKEIANKSRSALPSAILNHYQNEGMACIDGETQSVNPVFSPRNKSQVRNIRRKQKLSAVNCNLPKEDLYTLHSIGSEMVGFCHYARTYPQLACIVGQNELAVEVESILKLNSNLVVFSFHESYKVGRYCITPFSVVHCAFAEQPTFPCFFLLSEACDGLLLEKLLRCVSDSVPGLEEVPAVVVTSQQQAFTTSLTAVFPIWHQVYDWENLFGGVRAFLRKLNCDIKDISARIKQLKALWSSESLEEYLVELERLKGEWPEALLDYYKQTLASPIESRLGRWVLDRYRLYSQHSGVLQAVNADLQLVVKHLQELKVVSLDIILPSLYHLQSYFYVMIQRGFCGSSTLNLTSEFKFLRRDSDELILPSRVYEPSGIVKIFRVRGITLFSESPDSSDDDCSVLLQAQRIVEMGHVAHSTDLQAFLVKSTSGSLHGVQLFPRESCSCSVSQRCAHIVAAMLAVGMAVASDRTDSTKIERAKYPCSYAVSSHSPTSAPVVSFDAGHVDTDSNDALKIDLSAYSVAENSVIDGAGFASCSSELRSSASSSATDRLVEAAHALHQIGTAVTLAETDNSHVFGSTIPVLLGGAQSIVELNNDELASMLSSVPGKQMVMVVAPDPTAEKPTASYRISVEEMQVYANVDEQATATLLAHGMHVSNQSM